MKKLGFTLVELLVVVAVIGVLATVGMFGFTRAYMAGRDVQRIQTMTAMRRSILAYQLNQGYYPYGGFSKTVNLMSSAKVLTYPVVDPGCGSGPVAFPTGAMGDGDWQPCSGRTVPGYSYVLSDTTYQLILRKEAGGTLIWGSDYAGGAVPKHGECQGTACVLVDGEQSDQCTGDGHGQCWHNTCSGASCARTTGGGSDSCSSDVNCTHLACSGGACARVAGQGSDSCSGSGQGVCWHYGCSGASCAQVAGGGADSCSGNGYGVCWHYGCSGTSCAQVAGGGGNTCSGSGQGVCWHYACSGVSCTSVVGGGSDSCSGSGQGQCWHYGCSGASCTQLYGGGGDECSGDGHGSCWHIGCQNNACQVVNGWGGDSCTSDCDCHDCGPKEY